MMPTLPRGFRVYKATNKLNGNLYIGVTKLLLSKRKALHHTCARGKNNTRISQAIAKYGFDNFSFDDLYLFDNRRDAWDMEIMLISELNPAYNVDPGGPGTKHNLGKVRPKEWCDNISIGKRKAFERLSNGI